MQLMHKTFTFFLLLYIGVLGESPDKCAFIQKRYACKESGATAVCRCQAEEKIHEILWEQIKQINRTMPTYKYIKNLVATKEDFIKTTTAKIKRHEEMKKMN